MIAASEQPANELCAACFDGNYPLGMPEGNPNTELVRAMQARQSCETADPLEQFVQDAEEAGAEQ